MGLSISVGDFYFKSTNKASVGSVVSKDAIELYAYMYFICVDDARFKDERLRHHIICEWVQMFTGCD